MPLKKCQINGKSGWKFGDSGKCYSGKDGKKKAIKQGLVIDPNYFKNHASDEEFELAIEGLSISEKMALTLERTKDKKQ